MKYLVLKWEDIEKSGAGEQASRLLDDMHRFNPKTVQYHYLVVNEDEPYAHKVKALIEDYDRQKVDAIREDIIKMCDGVINCSPGTCLADKEIQIITSYVGDFPSKEDLKRHMNAISDVNHDYNQTFHRATHNPHEGIFKTRLFVGQADMMLTIKQVDALNLRESHQRNAPVEKLYTAG